MLAVMRPQRYDAKTERQIQPLATLFVSSQCSPISRDDDLVNKLFGACGNGDVERNRLGQLTRREARRRELTREQVYARLQAIR